jgi:hypothetical protein
MGRLRRRLLLRVGLGLLVAAVLLQLVPVGRPHANPPVRQDAPWPDGRTRQLAMTACYDCHSHQTRWPLHSYVAPFSWLIARDVEQGREELNFSDWAEDGDDAADAVADGSMPPTRYVLVHPDARLSDAERRLLADALASMRAAGDGNGGGGGEDGGGD